MGKRKRIAPPAVGDSVSVEYDDKWDEGVVTRVQGDEFWVAYDTTGGEEYPYPISIQQNVYKVLARAEELSQVNSFVEWAGEVTPAGALIYIRRAGGSLEDALNLYWAETEAVAAAEPAAAAAGSAAAAAAGPAAAAAGAGFSAFTTARLPRYSRAPHAKSLASVHISCVTAD